MTPAFPFPEDWNTDMEKIQLQLLPKRRQICTVGRPARTARERHELLSLRCHRIWGLL